MQQLIAYIKTQRKLGKSDGVIIDSLKKSGWSEGDILISMDLAKQNVELPGVLPIHRLFQISWILLRKNFLKFVCLVLVLRLILLTLDQATQAISWEIIANAGGNLTFFMLGFGLLAIKILSLALIAYFLCLIVIQSQSLKNLSWKNFLNQAWQKFPSALWVVLTFSLLVLSGYYFLYIPAIIFVILYAPSVFLIFISKVRGMGALSASRRLVIENFGKYLLRLIFAVSLYFIIFAVGRYLSDLSLIKNLNILAVIFKNIFESFAYLYLTLYGLVLTENIFYSTPVVSKRSALEITLLIFFTLFLAIFFFGLSVPYLQ